MAVMSMSNMNIDIKDSNLKIRCLATYCNKLCTQHCQCTGHLCEILCKSNPWGIPEKKPFCYAHCCAVELRNITAIPEIVDIPNGNVRLVIKYTDIEIIKDDSLKNNWSEISLTYSKITIIEPNAFKNLTKLEKLYLNNNLISYIHHGTFAGSDNLFDICIHNNMLITVYSFSGIKTLSSLTLFSNRISSGTFCTSRQSFKNENITKTDFDIARDCKFTNVEYLDLKGNNMKPLTKNKFRNFKELYNLDLSQNKLSQIEDGTFAMNTNLRYLALSNNLITDFSAESFPGTLRRLDLDGNRLIHLKSNMFYKMKDLQFLHLQENYISVIDEDTFKFNTQLRKIYLQGNKITTIKEETFKYNVLLQELNLQANEILTCHWLNHLTKTLRYLKLKFPTVSNDSCSKSLTCKMDEDPVFQAVTFKLPEFNDKTFFHELNKNFFGGVLKDIDLEDLKIPGFGSSVSHLKDISCTFCECQKQKGMRYVFEYDSRSILTNI